MLNYCIVQVICIAIFVKLEYHTWTCRRADAYVAFALLFKCRVAQMSFHADQTIMSDGV